MKKTTILSLLLLFLASPGDGLSRLLPLQDDELGRMETLEKLLREAKVKKIEKNMLGGRTGPWLVTLEAGTVKQQAVFRYVDRPRPNPTPDSYKYDIAAYELTKLLGIDLIPPVVEREIDGRPGSLQVYLEDCIREKDRKRRKLQPPDSQVFSNAVAAVRVFESLTADECQDTDDLYVHKEDWQVCRVDFSEAFAPSPELLPGCEITVCSRALYDGLLKLDEEALKLKLGRYLGEEEFAALQLRKKLILERIQALIAERGEDAVLF